MKKFKIAYREIGEGCPTFIIAEAGSNHNRDILLAKKLIDAAAEAGADAIKFQLFKADKLYVPSAGSADYLKNNKNIFDIIKSMEMPYEWLPELSEYATSNNLVFLSSVFDEESADIFSKFSPAFKIASYEVTHLPLIKYVAKKNKPMIISTGLANIGEMQEALGACFQVGNKNVALLHCIAQYPANPEIANLNVIKTMKLAFDVPIGYSDHTFDPTAAPEVAVALGAKIIEKTFTLDRKMPGPDHSYSLEPLELKRMSKAIRIVEKLSDSDKAKLVAKPSSQKLSGSSVRTIFPGEEELRDFARRYIYSTKRIEKGEMFVSNNVRALRSGKAKHGLEPKFLEIILGRCASRKIMEFEPITWNEVLS
ncbi:MAG: N-acetylneuraminate synthase family protein [Candidatus Micrarchaeota archaeon]|nr:N-acetylneuraminate synthase family protein [Candidatus Micrarchaeota archaeon]